MTKDIKELTDQDLANKWRKGVDQNRKLSQELLDRGYKFRCSTHSAQLSFHDSNEVIITKLETVEL